MKSLHILVLAPALCFAGGCNGAVNGGNDESNGAVHKDAGDENTPARASSGGSKSAGGAGSQSMGAGRPGGASKDAGAGTARDAAMPPPSADAGETPAPGPGKDSGTEVTPPVSTDPSCPTGAILCEDFESGSDLDADKWDPGDKTAPAQRHFAIDTELGNDGKRSVHLRFGPNTGGGSMMFATRKPLAVPSDRLYVRYYIRFADVTFPGFHPILVSLAEKDLFSVFSIPTIGFGTIRGEPALEAITDVLDSSQIWTDDDLKAGRWTCMEMMFFGGTGPAYDDEEARVWVDSKEIDAMHATDARWFDPNVARWSPKYDGSFLRIGAASFPPGDGEPVLEYWIDSVVVSQQPIGCL